MKRQWENEELVEYWILSPWDLAQVGNKTGTTRLGFAVLLKFFQREGRFPFFKNEVTSVVISFVAIQVDVAPELYLQYAWTGSTIEYHRAQIRKALGFRESTKEDAERMQKWLIADLLDRIIRKSVFASKPSLQVVQTRAFGGSDIRLSDPHHPFRSPHF